MEILLVQLSLDVMTMEHLIKYTLGEFQYSGIVGKKQCETMNLQS